MKSKSQRMQDVVRLADREERRQAEQFSARQRHLAQQRQKLSELQQYYREYNEKCASPTARFDLQCLQENRRFMAKLAQAISLQKEQVAKAEQAADVERKQWLSSRRRSMSLEKLQQRYGEEEHREAERLEQSRSDELSAQRFIWALRNTETLA